MKTIKKNEIGFDCPKEIEDFLSIVFCLHAVLRRIIGKRGSITFEVRSKEQNHCTPHVHASYQGYNISIEIESTKVLAGNLPKKQQKLAIKWVKDNKVKLMNDWENYVFTAECTFIGSDLSRFDLE